MNFRSTFLLFGLFLAMLWTFGLMVSLKRGPKEETFLLPALHAERDKIKDKIDHIHILRERGKRPDGTPIKDEFVFTKQKDGSWTMEVPPLKRAIKVEEHVPRSIYEQVLDAQAA